MKEKKQALEEKDILNNALLNVITPMGMEFTTNSVTIGEQTGKIYGINRYPQKTEIGWLSKITNIPNSFVTIGFEPVDNNTLISSISRSVVQQRGIAEGAKDPLSRQRAEKAADDGERIIMQVDREGETVGLMSIVIMPHTSDESKLKRILRAAESIVAGLKCKMRVLPNLQQECFRHIAPTFPTNKKIESILQRVVPLSTIIGGFPFASSGFHDGQGYYMGQDSSGGMVVVDPWKRGNDRTNTNFVIMGNSGTGKSTCIKHLLINEFAFGTKIIIIDPESEVRHEVA
ncbi:MAG: type IV secretory system conjugative DNA transfer family protein [Eubacteriales bacterium]